MDALKMAAVVSADACLPKDPALALDPSETTLAPRMKAALAALFEAGEYARDLSAEPWDFAIEISTLRRMKLSNSDLRWLVVRGVVDHAVEVTLGGEAQRSFRHPARLIFSKRTCFVLSSVGRELARGFGELGERRPRSEARSASEPRVLGVVRAPQPLVPRWDRDRQELRVGTTLVKQFKIPAGGPEAILAAFEEKSWPPRIEDPLVFRCGPLPAEQLELAIAQLNKQQRNRLIRFRADSDGKGITWELCVDQACEA